MAKSRFIVWKAYQRRAESLGKKIDLEVNYFHHQWEEKNRVLKGLSYITKTIGTAAWLLRERPQTLVVQLPPTPLLYLAVAYQRLYRARVVADCHNAMIDGRWAETPFAVNLLRRLDGVVAHNEDIKKAALEKGIDAEVIKDPLPDVRIHANEEGLGRVGVTKHDYVIVPWNYASDEPIEELVRTAWALPGRIFVATWFRERFSYRGPLPKNLIFTGYLEPADFENLFACAGAALTLTTREGTQPSAAAEGIAMGIPIIISDTKIARSLYQDGVIYVKNYAPSIASGVEEALARRRKWVNKVDGLRRRREWEQAREVELMKRLLV